MFPEVVEKHEIQKKLQIGKKAMEAEIENIVQSNVLTPVPKAENSFLMYIKYVCKKNYSHYSNQSKFLKNGKSTSVIFFGGDRFGLKCNTYTNKMNDQNKIVFRELIIYLRQNLRWALAELKKGEK